MANATPLLLDPQWMTEMFFSKEPAARAKSLFMDGWYKAGPSMYFNEEGEAAAEEYFDLTNNPSRQYSREKYYGRGRSLSVGDMVEVDGVLYLCASEGWVEVMDRAAAPSNWMEV